LTRISTTQPKREREPSSYSSPYARTQNPLLDNANRARVIEAFEKPSLPIDMDEFRREVADQGLKTLKDSRWAK
jgi:hypothetical protein